MWPDLLSNPRPLTYESVALRTALRGQALEVERSVMCHTSYPKTTNATGNNNATEINRREYDVNTCLGITCHGSK